MGAVTSTTCGAMGHAKPTARDIFDHAAEIPFPDERHKYVAEACGGDADLRQRVDALLAAYERAGSFLETPAAAAAAAIAEGLEIGATSDWTTDPATPPLREGPGSVIGPYKLLEQIGEGGMGVVFLAEQIRPVRRQVALKVVKAGMDTRQVVARFEAERQALALMDHPGIAKVFDGSATDSGRPYFVMELVKGIPITRYCDERRLTPRQRLELFVQVCSAVQHAHTKGVIHRDIKPTNVLVALYDDKPVPKVIDFGVAKATGQRLTERTMFTGLGAVVGTPEYMSPEQAEMNQLDIDTRSDIYSLGVLLYELLTGTTPIEHKRVKEAALLEVLRVIREEEPPRPSTRLTTIDQLPSIAAQRGVEPAKLTGIVRGELDWIVMKALEKDRNRRYETANGLVRDIERYLHDEPVHACPPSVVYRFRKFARRNKASIAVATACVALLVTAVVALSVSNVLIGRERDQRQAAFKGEQIALGQARDSAAKASAHLAQAQKSERSMRHALYAARIAFAAQAAQSADVPRMVELLNSLRPLPDQEDLRGFEWYHLWQICHSNRLKLQEFAEVLALAYSPDGKTLLSGAGSQASVWDPSTGEKITRFAGAAGTVRAIAFSPDGTLFAVGAGNPSGTGELSIWDAATRERKRVITNLPEPVHCLTFTRDGKRIAIGMANVVKTGVVGETSHGHSIEESNKPERIRFVDTVSGKQIAHIAENTESILSVAFSPDGKTLVSGSYDGRVANWDTESGAQRASSLDRFNGPVSALAFSPDGTVLALGCGTWEQPAPVMLYEFPSMKPLRRLPGHTAGVRALAFSSDGTTLLSGSYDRTAIVWNIHTGWKINHFKSHSHFVLSVAMSPDGKSVATGSRDAVICTSDIRIGSNDLQPIRASGFDIAYLPDGRAIIGSSHLVLYDRKAATTRPIDRMDGGDVILAASSEGSWFAAVSGSAGDLKIFDARTLERRHYFPGPGKEVPNRRLEGVSISPDGKLIATGGSDDKVTIRETESGRLVSELRPLGHRIRCLSFSPDGRTLATATIESVSRTQIWDLSSGKPIATFDPGAFSLTYSADGSLLATGGATNVSIYDTHTLKLVRSFRGHNEDIFCIAFSPDGKTLASAGFDKTLRLWCVSNGEPLLMYPMEGAVWGVAFSPDGRTVAASTSFGTHFFDSAEPNAADEGPDGISHRWRSLFAAGKADKAEQELQSGIDGYTRREGADSAIAAHLTAELAELLVSRRDSSRYAQAETLLAGARAVLIKNLPSGHTWRYRANAVARELYGPEALNDPAKRTQIEAALVARPATAPTIPEAGKWTINDLDPINVEAWKLRRDGKLEESAALREQVVAEAKRLLPPDDIRLVKYLLGYGDVLTLLRRFEQAEARYRQASSILEHQSVPAPQEKTLLAASLNSLQKAKRVAATQPTAATATPTTSHSTPASAQQLLAWDRISPQDVSRSVQSALVADLASSNLLPFDRLVYGEHLILGGEPSRAVTAIRQALEEAKKIGAAPPYYYKSLGWALLACGESEQAAAALSQALGDESRWEAASLPADADPDQWTAAYLLSRVTQDQYTSHFTQSAYPSFPWFYVGQLMESQRKREVAELAYRKATSLGAHHTRHWAAYRMQSLSKQPDSPTTRPTSSAK